jgi:hypothetical protein
MGDVSGASVLDIIASSLVAQEKYASKEDALRALAQDAVRAKIAHYRRRSQRLQRKYALDFAGFTRKLAGRATPQEEDDWVNWRSAQAMLEEWQAVYLSLAPEPERR